MRVSNTPATASEMASQKLLRAPYGCSIWMPPAPFCVSQLTRFAGSSPLNGSSGPARRTV